MSDVATWGVEARERVGKLLAKLASPHDAEIVATVKAIERALSADGLDLHTLADFVTRAELTLTKFDDLLRAIFGRMLNEIKAGGWTLTGAELELARRIEAKMVGTRPAGIAAELELLHGLHVTLGKRVGQRRV
jgi:hypothetical protein